MSGSLFQKWWLILLQGILLIVLSIYVFNNPVSVLAGISLWFGLLVLATGVIGLISWMSDDAAPRERSSLLWSIVTIILGLLMVLNLMATMKTITVVFGLWMLASGLWLMVFGWALKENNSLGWLALIAGLLSVIAGVMMIFNIGTGAVGISTLLGLQVLLTGLALVLMAFTKKAISGAIKDKVVSVKNRYQ